MILVQMSFSPNALKADLFFLFSLGDGERFGSGEGKESFRKLASLDGPPRSFLTRPHCMYICT